MVNRSARWRKASNSNGAEDPNRSSQRQRGYRSLCWRCGLELSAHSLAETKESAAKYAKQPLRRYSSGG